jgi:ribonuclease G
MKTIAPNKLSLLKLYRGKSPIFEYYGIDKQIQSSFGKKVSLSSGVYLIIEHTEAMHVIDVNSGQRLKKDTNQESTAYKVNVIAAKGIARQLRLRDMGGIIVIDFIDMRKHEHRQQLYEIMKEEMNDDHAKHTILPPTKFGLIQITRERVRPTLKIETGEKCPVCKGSGKSQASVLILEEIETNLQFLVNDQNEKSITLKVHPFIHAFLTKGFFNYSRKWRLKYKAKIKVVADSSYHYLEYHFFNKFNAEIKTS